MILPDFNYTIAYKVLNVDANFHTGIGVYHISITLKKLVNTLCFIFFIPMFIYY
jgi:hypothetical protein